MTKQTETIPTEVEVSQPRSFTARIIIDVIGRWGARLGLVWIAALIVTAVFAPFIASSHPILMKDASGWSSPMLRHLTPVDVILLLGFFIALGIWLLRMIPRHVRLWGGGGLSLLTIAFAFTFVSPPQLVVYSSYREGLANREIEKAYMTLVPYSPTDRLRDAPDPRLLPPGAYVAAESVNDRFHLMGTTGQGEDLASRMIHASRIALSIGFIATGIALLIGITIGGLMGYFSGIFDLLGMRLVEIFSAIPTIFLLIAIVAFYGRNLYLMMVIIGLTSWVGYALFTRAEFLRLRQQDFVTAARACGLPLWSILFRHMLPNGITPVLVTASFGVASAILTESTLSFLGLGLVEEPSWGQMLNEARGSGRFYWWLAMYPGGAIFLTVFAYNLVGEALRDAIDPHTQRANV